MNTFHSLINGAKFNKAKHGEAINLFKTGTKESNLITKLDTPASLDFFGNSKVVSEKNATSSVVTQSKKRKRENDDEEIETREIQNKNKNIKNKKKKEIVKEEYDDEDEEDEDEISLIKTQDNTKMTKKIKKDKETIKSNQKNDIFEYEEHQAFRKRMGINVTGDDVPFALLSFDDIHLNKEDGHIKKVILENIEKSQYKEPTPIQMQAIPVLLNDRDILAVAPTGSGKTAAYIIPIIATLKAPKKDANPRSLILSPTRELASQIEREFVRLSVGKKFKVILLNKANSNVNGGVLKCDSVISTPLRLVHLVKEEQINLSEVKMLILDEADRLFELGFVHDIDAIISACSNTMLVRGLFSATLPEGVENLARTVLKDPIRVLIGTRNAGGSDITQKMIFVGKEQGKLLAVRQMFSKGLKPPVIVFLQSKDRAQELFKELVYDGINVDVIHADRTQAQRDEIIKRFRIGEIWVLIATDLMARGIDFKGVKMVINYDFPQSTVDYVHRIGRTGRAGQEGTAITFFTEDDMPMVRSIANVIRLSGGEVPDWMLTLKKMGSKKRKILQTKAPERFSISTKSNFDKKKIAKKKNIKNNARK